MIHSVFSIWQQTKRSLRLLLELGSGLHGLQFLDPGGGDLTPGNP